VVRIDAGIGQPQSIDRPAMHKMLLDDLLGVIRMSKPIPDRFWIDHQHRAVLALIQAASFIHANPMLQASRFHSVLERAAQFLRVLVAAAGAVSGFVTLIQTDKQVMLEDWHRDILMQDWAQGCGTA
jgi:hypothetical protein